MRRVARNLQHINHQSSGVWSASRVSGSLSAVWSQIRSTSTPSELRAYVSDEGLRVIERGVPPKFAAHQPQSCEHLVIDVGPSGIECQAAFCSTSTFWDCGLGISDVGPSGIGRRIAGCWLHGRRLQAARLQVAGSRVPGLQAAGPQAADIS